MEHETDVVIVGAGLSGLAAARRLAASGLESIVLEARGRVGGRTLNEQLDNGEVVELGGEWVGPKHTRIVDLARELDIETFSTYDSGDRVFEFDGGVTRYSGDRPKASALGLLDYRQAELRLERMARAVPLEQPWAARKASQWDSETARSWIRRNARTRLAREILELAIQAVQAIDSDQLSLLHLLYYIRAGDGMHGILGTTGGAQQYRFVGGSQLVALRMAAELEDAIVLETPVTRISQSPEEVSAHGDDLTVRGRRAIVAMSPALAGAIAYEPSLPALRAQLTQHMPLGTVIKCMAVYEEPWWRADGLSGQAASTIGPVKSTFDNSPPGGSPGVLLGFILGGDARRLGEWTPAERRSAVLGCFARYFGARAQSPIQYLERAWADEHWSRGCYAGYMPPGGWTSYGRALTKAVGRIHWAGAESDLHWSGSMDGAVRAGERAADEVLAGETHEYPQVTQVP